MPGAADYPASNRLRDTAVGERPQERLEKHGAAALSDTELLAMLLRSGTQGQDVLTLAGRLIGEAALSHQPDAAIAIGDHVYWDLRFGRAAMTVGGSPWARQVAGDFQRDIPVLGKVCSAQTTSSQSRNKGSGTTKKGV